MTNLTFSECSSNCNSGQLAPNKTFLCVRFTALMLLTWLFGFCMPRALLETGELGSDPDPNTNYAASQPSGASV